MIELPLLKMPTDGTKCVGCLLKGAYTLCKTLYLKDGVLACTQEGFIVVEDTPENRVLAATQRLTT